MLENHGNKGIHQSIIARAKERAATIKADHEAMQNIVQGNITDLQSLYSPTSPEETTNES
jgi:hypothetical protein